MREFFKRYIVGLKALNYLATTSLASHAGGGVDSFDIKPTNFGLKGLAFEVKLLEVESVGDVKHENDS